MTHAVLVLSLLLAAVFAFAGVSKLSDLEGARASAAALGVPDSLAAPVGVLAAAVELGAAVILLAAPRFGAGAAIGLLAVFSAPLAVAWLRGRDEGCGCFGPLLDARPGSALARNAGLASLAAVVVAGPAVSGLDLLAATLAAVAIGSCALPAARIASRRAARTALQVSQSPSLPAGPITVPAVSRRQVVGAAAAAGAAGWLGGLAGRIAPASGTLAIGIACSGTGCCCACTCSDVTGQCTCVCTGCRGIAGGGTLAATGGTASFSVFASAMAFPRTGKKLIKQVLGSLQWSDPAAGIFLRSTRIDAYGPVGDSKTARRVRGIAQVDGHGRQPFVLTTDDGGRPGSGKDTVELKVGAAAGGSGDFSYSEGGPLTAGDIHGLQVELFKPRKSST